MSEKKDKRECNKRLRRKAKIKLQKTEEYIEPKKEEIKDTWLMAKDRGD